MDDPVALVLERLERDELLLDAVEALQLGERRRQVLGGADEDAALLDRLARRRLDAVELEQVGGLVHVVDDVVDARGELVDVLAVERGDVLRVQELDQVVRDRVALVLGLLHVRVRDRRVGILPEALLDAPPGLEGVRTGPREEVVELGRPWNQGEPQAGQDGTGSPSGHRSVTFRSSRSRARPPRRAPAGADTRIVAIGDFGVGGDRQRLTGSAVERFAARRGIDALVTLGDNDYTERPAAFESNWLGSFGWAAADGLLVAGTLGNHDVRVDRGRYEFELLGMPGRYYRRRLGNVELFLLDSNRLGPTQLAWLDSALAASDARWKVVAMHHPAYSCGGYLGDRRVRSRLVPIFELGRRRPRPRRPRPQLPALRQPRGVTYVVHGGGGRGLYPSSRARTGSRGAVRPEERHGWLYLRADAGRSACARSAAGAASRTASALYP